MILQFGLMHFKIFSQRIKQYNNLCVRNFIKETQFKTHIMNFKKSIALIVFGLLGYTTFAQNSDQESHKEEQKLIWRNKGDNFIRFYLLGTQHDGGVSIGLDYERLMDEKGSMGLIVPVYYSFGNSFMESSSSGYFYFSPGLKFYPGLQRKVTYAVGPNLLFGKGRYSEWFWDGSSERRHTVDHTIFGVMIKNYLNVNLNSSFNFSMDFGLGVTYINRQKSSTQVTAENLGPSITGSFNLGFGYRF